MILVTGATGLVGSHLIVELTKEGKSVRALKRKGSSTALVNTLFSAYSKEGDALVNQGEWVEGDVEDFHSLKDALIGVDEVYHCAAMVSFSQNNNRKMLSVNVLGTANMVDACIELGVKRFCHVSSIAALGSSTMGQPIDEEATWGKSKGKSVYAVSKFLSEMEVQRGVELGLNAVIVNPSVIIGPGRWDSGSGQLFGAIERGFPFYTLGSTGYVDVRDVARAMVAAMEKGLCGRRYILNGENLRHKEVFEMIASELGKRKPYIKVSPWLSEMAWPLAWLVGKISGKTPALTKDTARSGHSVTSFSSKRAEEELHIAFTPISEAVRNTVKVGRI